MRELFDYGEDNRVLLIDFFFQKSFPIIWQLRGRYSAIASVLNVFSMTFG